MKNEILNFNKKWKNFERDFGKLINNSVFDKTMQYVQKLEYIKPINNEQKSYLSTKPSCHEMMRNLLGWEKH